MGPSKKLNPPRLTERAGPRPKRNSKLVLPDEGSAEEEDAIATVTEGFQGRQKIARRIDATIIPRTGSPLQSPQKLEQSLGRTQELAKRKLA